MLLYRTAQSQFAKFPADAIVLRCRRLLELLATCNLLINGPDADNRTTRLKDVPADVAYGVQEIQVQLSETLTLGLQGNLATQDVKLLCQCLFMIAHAWSAVLAGDISDILGTLQLELLANEIEFDSRLLISSGA